VLDRFINRLINTPFAIHSVVGKHHYSHLSVTSKHAALDGRAHELGAASKEVEMSRMIIATIAAATFLASAGSALARPKAQSYVDPRGSFDNYYNYSGDWPNNYYDRSYWNGIYGVAPGPQFQPNPYRGTIWYGVAPY
jgi:hypothetical protein